MIMTDYIKNSMFYIKSDQIDSDAIHGTVVSGGRLKGAPLIILFCAIVVASQEGEIKIE